MQCVHSTTSSSCSCLFKVFSSIQMSDVRSHHVDSQPYSHYQFSDIIQITLIKHRSPFTKEQIESKMGSINSVASILIFGASLTTAAKVEPVKLPNSLAGVGIGHTAENGSKFVCCCGQTEKDGPELCDWRPLKKCGRTSCVGGSYLGIRNAPSWNNGELCNKCKEAEIPK